MKFTSFLVLSACVFLAFAASDSESSSDSSAASEVEDNLSFADEAEQIEDSDLDAQPIPFGMRPQITYTPAKKSNLYEYRVIKHKDSALFNGKAVIYFKTGLGAASIREVENKMTDKEICNHDIVGLLNNMPDGGMKQMCVEREGIPSYVMTCVGRYHCGVTDSNCPYRNWNKVSGRKDWAKRPIAPVTCCTHFGITGDLAKRCVVGNGKDSVFSAKKYTAKARKRIQRKNKRYNKRQAKKKARAAKKAAQERLRKRQQRIRNRRATAAKKAKYDAKLKKWAARKAHKDAMHENRRQIALYKMNNQFKVSKGEMSKREAKKDNKRFRKEQRAKRRAARKARRKARR